MKLINNTPDRIGNYGVIQTTTMNYVPEHMAFWPDELETETYARYMGFVTIEFETVEPEPVATEEEPAETETEELTGESVEVPDADVAEEPVEAEPAEEPTETEPVDEPEPDMESSGGPIAPYLRVVSYAGNQEALDAYLATLPEPEDPEPTTDERVAALEEENTLLKAQITAQSEQMDFYEDCIAEMAAVVYA